MGRFKRILNEINKPRKEEIMDSIKDDDNIKFFFGLTSKLNSMRALDFFSGMRFVNKEMIDMEKIGKYKISKIDIAIKEIKSFIDKIKKYISSTIDLDTENEFKKVQEIYKELLNIKKKYKI